MFTALFRNTRRVLYSFLLIHTPLAFAQTNVSHVSNFIEEYKQLGKIRSVSPSLYSVIMDINLVAAEKCGFVFPSTYLSKAEVTSFLLVLISQKEFQTIEPYFETLRGMDCDNINSGIASGKALFQKMNTIPPIK